MVFRRPLSVRYLILKRFLTLSEFQDVLIHSEYQEGKHELLQVQEDSSHLFTTAFLWVSW